MKTFQIKIALDPAGPYYEVIISYITFKLLKLESISTKIIQKNTPPAVRVDASDADFVDVIHTNGASAGLLNAAAGIFRPVGLVGKMSLFKKKTFIRIINDFCSAT